MAGKTPDEEFKELSQALEDVGRHAYNRGRLVETGQEEAARGEYDKWATARGKVLRFLKKKLVES